MSGIYLHVPFCKQACDYCDFHFSTSVKRKDEMLSAMKKEMEMRRDELDSPVKTIYLGGGTPSLLHPEEIEELISRIKSLFSVESDAEITLEVNPDDLDKERLMKIAQSPVNRLSIGIQSFEDPDLKFMNRAHDREQALRSLAEACNYFGNISIDLIYGLPGMSEKHWKANLRKAFDFPIQHISSYALTVEPRTALDHYIRAGKCPAPSEDEARMHFEFLMKEADKQGFIHYEVSNFAKEGFLSRHNTSYWQGEHYLGIGPSAHSYSGNSRSWNVSNNARYLKALQKGEIDHEREVLSSKDMLNEMIMTRLRTMWGLSMQQVETEFGKEHRARIQKMAGKFIDQGLLKMEAERLIVNQKGFFLIDGMASDLFSD